MVALSKSTSAGSGSVTVTLLMSTVLGLVTTMVNCTGSPTCARCKSTSLVMSGSTTMGAGGLVGAGGGVPGGVVGVTVGVKVGVMASADEAATWRGVDSTSTPNRPRATNSQPIKWNLRIGHPL